MKKSYFYKITTILLFLSLCGCKDKADPSYITKEFSDITNLFIINPTEKDKIFNDNWFEIESSSRAVESASELIEIKEKYEHPVFLPDENLKLKSSRDAEEKIKTTTYKKGESHSFNITDYTNGTISAKLKYTRNHCYIWQSDNEEDKYKLSDNEIIKLAEVFDKIYEKETLLCGPKYSGKTIYQDIIQPDDKISILLTCFKKDNVLGFFSPETYNKNQSGINNIEALFINLLYINENTKEEIYSTIFHEFNHMLNYANKNLKGQNYKSWYTEMLSMITEDFFIDDFNIPFELSPKFRLPTFIQQGFPFGFGNWDNALSGQSSYNYANAYAFGAFLARNFGGAELIHEIATNEFANEESVVNAVNKINGTKYSFNDLLCKFSTILINPKNENTNLPSLYKSVEQKLYNENEQEFTFRLSEIDLSNLTSRNTTYKISPCIIDNNGSYLNSYGFQYYVFPKNSKVKITYKNFLRIQAF